MIKLAIVGSRGSRVYIDKLINYLNHNYMNYLPELAGKEITELVSGSCLNSPDQDVKEYCESSNYRYFYKEFLPNEIKYPQTKYGNSRFYIRNKEIVEYSDIIVICYDGISKGSKTVINLCKQLNKNHLILSPLQLSVLGILKQEIKI